MNVLDFEVCRQLLAIFGPIHSRWPHHANAKLGLLFETLLQKLDRILWPLHQNLTKEMGEEIIDLI